MHNITSPAAEELKRPMPRTLAPYPPPIPVGVCVCWGGCGQWLQMTGALRIKLPKFGEVK